MRELWAELGATMRKLRHGADVSLRRAEAESGRGRGMLSQIENGRARPGRDIVEWYDTAFGGDGLLLSIYAEARGAHGRPVEAVGAMSVRREPGDELSVDKPLLPSGAVVAPDSQVTAGWTLVNTGTVRWRERRLTRIGAHAAVRLIGSPPWVPIPDTGSGQTVDVEVPVQLPAVAGTFAAYWQMTDADANPCFEMAQVLAVVLTAVPGAIA